MDDKIKLDTGTEIPKSFVFTEEFEKIFNDIENSKSNLFITGKAGCGKSTLLEYARQNTKKNYAIVAPTGITAIKAKGMTIHKLFHLPAHFVRERDIKILKEKELLKKLDILFIDECSMMRADILDAVDKSLRKNRSINKPFGGVQVVMFGDLLQLQPVVTKNEIEIVDSIYPDGSYFFNSKVFEESNFQTKELTKIFRQSDKSFINLLNKFRIAKIDQSDLDAINKRYVGDDFKIPDGVILLSTNNAKVDEINNDNLSKLKTKTYEYEGEVKGDFKENDSQSPKILKLKVGAQVMLTKNDVGNEPRRWSNGTLAIIHELYPDKIKIKINEKIFTVGKNRWEKFQFTVAGGGISKKVVATFIQYPLKLAWAVTIHKSQGQTFERVAIDLDKGSFAHGQTYVALSRAKSIDGIYLIREISFGDLIFDHRVFNFLGHDLEERYLEEIKKINETKQDKPIYESRLPRDDSLDKVDINEDWTESEDKKLLMLYKKNVPEHALANIFKKKRSEIRTRVLKLLNK